MLSHLPRFEIVLFSRFEDGQYLLGRRAGRPLVLVKRQDKGPRATLGAMNRADAWRIKADILGAMEYKSMTVPTLFDESMQAFNQRGQYDTCFSA